MQYGEKHFGYNSKPRSGIINCLTVDVEGFIEANLENFALASRYVNHSLESYEIEKNVDVLLQILAAFGVRATVFILGRIADELPQVVTAVTQAGHELGCHGYYHRRIFNLSKDDFQEQTRRAKNSLEQVSGKRIYGFRAPDFSVTTRSAWALDVIWQTGFLYDSSLYPITIHDYYGLKDSEPYIHKLPNGMIEWPMSTFQVFGYRLPFGGGGYFRLLPLLATKLLIASHNSKGYPCMFYIHPYEIGPVLPRIPELGAFRKYRHYRNCANGADRFKSLLRAFVFGPAIEILKECGMMNEQTLPST